MKIETRVVIAGKPVTEFFRKDDIVVYIDDDKYDDQACLYFTKGDTVLFKLDVGADYGQAMGYISHLQFSDCKE